MATSLATQQQPLTKSKRIPGGIPKPPDWLTLEEMLEERLGKRPRSDRLERDDAALRWSIKRGAVDGRRYRTTIAQVAAGMGYPTSGLSRQEVFNRFHMNVRRALDSLAELGLLRWGGVTWEDGRMRCIEVELLARTDNDGQRTRIYEKATCAGRGRRLPRTPRLTRRGEPVDRRYLPPAHRRPSLFSSPRNVKALVEGSPPTGGPPRNSTGEPFARVRRADHETRARERPPTGNGNGKDRVGHRSRRHPRRPRHPDRDRLIDAFEQLLDRPARFSHRRHGERLDRALYRLDQYAHFGQNRRSAGLEFAITLIEGQREEEAEGSEAQVGSLAYFIPLLEVTSKEWRRGVKSRRRKKSARAESPLDPGDPNPQGGLRPNGR